MYHYYLSRGIDVVKVLAENFKSRTWWLPDLIPCEIIDEVQKKVKGIEFYHVNDDFTWSAKISGPEPKVFYVVDYFGRESRVGRDGPPNTVVIRDSVWFPRPFSPIENNQVWFNSFRKIIRGTTGSSMVSPYRISGPNEVPNIFQHSALTWQEISIRFDNYYHCKDVFGDLALNYDQEFPSVFPIMVKNRDKLLMELDTPLPGMWKNSYNLPNHLYKSLTFIPLDSRFSKQALSELAVKIKAFQV
jgi:hypothetical protein